jgi:hypothetical protein
MQLKQIYMTPPGGWRYYQLETGFPMKAITFETLLRQISQHRANNHLRPIAEGFETLAAEIEHWLCQQMSPKDQTRKCKTGIRSRESVGWREVLGFLETNAEFLAEGAEQVPQEEAERRASICSTCPLNVRVDGCGVCVRTVNEYRTRLLKATPTSKDGLIKACGVCGCDLKSIVHLPLSALRAKGDKDYPDWCWQKRESK